MNNLGIGIYADANARPQEVYDRFGYLNLQLVMLAPEYAKLLRANDKEVVIGLRPDFGNDPLQINYLISPDREAARWGDIIRGHLAKVPEGTYDFTTGINEFWPSDHTLLQWRAAFELALCRIVQNQLGLAYAWGSIPVGNLDAGQVSMFADVFREAWAVNYHGYVKPNTKSVEGLEEPWWLHRPYMIWKPELDKLGIPLRLFLGETGPFYAPPISGMTAEQNAKLQIDIAAVMAQQAVDKKFTFYGACGFAAYVDGQMFTDGWDIREESEVYNKTVSLIHETFYGDRPLKFVRVIDTPPPPVQTELNGMLRVAIIPSNQDQNPVVGGSNEKVQMERFVDALFSTMVAYKHIEVKVFNGTPQSKDTYNLQGLITQTDAAYNWLTTAPVGTLTVALNLHSDSGSNSHVGYYYCDGTASVSFRLAKTLGSAIAREFGTDTILSDDYSEYIFSTHMRGKHAPVLLEMGSHSNVHDVEVLSNKASDIAQAITDTMLNFFTVSRELKVVPVPTATYRIGEGFANYLKAHPEAGQPRHDEAADIYGNTYVWLTSTDKYPKGAMLMWRKWLNKVQLISWENV